MAMISHESLEPAAAFKNAWTANQLKGALENAEGDFTLDEAGSEYTHSHLTYFYLSEFVDMDVTKTPDPVDLTVKLARLHESSVSPTGKFGFHVMTCDGKMAHTVEWEDSWAVFFAKVLHVIAKLDAIEKYRPAART